MTDKKSKPDPKKVDKVYTELVNVYKKHKLNVADILLSVGNLVYTLGASVGGYKEGKGPSLDELNKSHAEQPSLPVAMMLTGIQITDWQNDLDKKYEEIVKELKDKKNG